MFTGIIQDIGTIRSIRPEGTGSRIVIATRLVDKQMNVGDSIAVSGVCLTATDIDVRSGEVAVTAVRETLAKSTLGMMKSGSRVNLELALRPNDRLGGHFVQGHVDASGECASIKSLQGSTEVVFTYPQQFAELMVEKGSVAVDGVSLTAYHVAERDFAVSLIPHTMVSTTFRELKPGQPVNLEFDILGKYVLRISKRDGKRLSMEKLREFGY